MSFFRPPVDSVIISINRSLVNERLRATGVEKSAVHKVYDLIFMDFSWFAVSSMWLVVCIFSLDDVQETKLDHIWFSVETTHRNLFALICVSILK